MRRNGLSKNDRVDIKSNEGQMNCSTQENWYSCGAFVMQAGFPH